MRDRSKRYGGLPLGVTATAAATAAKVVTITGFTQEIGDMFAITFTSGNTASAMTLNVNSLGAKNIRLNNANTNTTTATLAAGATILLFYDGTYYQMVGSQRTTDTNTNTYDRMLLSISLIAGVAIEAYKLCMLDVNGKLQPLTTTGGTGTTKTVNVNEFLVGSPIFWYLRSTTITAGSLIGTLYTELGAAELSYTANQTSGFTANKPIYLKGRVEPSGNFRLDNTSYTSWLTQTLPTTDDGYVYILLGYMNNTTSYMGLVINHPIYEYKEGKLRQYLPAHTHNYADKPICAFDSVVTTGSWSANATVPGYGYRAAITMAGVTTNYAPEVTFCQADAASGLYSMEARTYSGGTYIYANAVPPASITIPTIVCKKVVY